MSIDDTSVESATRGATARTSHARNAAVMLRAMSRDDDAPRLRHAVTEVHGRYFVRPPRAPANAAWLIGFHGQSQTADAFLADLERTPGAESWLLASIQGLNRYYAGRSRSIVAAWMTSQDRDLAIADNVRWVDTVLDALEGEFGAPRAIVFAGFSQGVGMAYRAGLLGRRRCAAIAAVCGDVPPELRTPSGRAWPRVVVMTGSSDEWYTPARLEEDLTFLRSVRPDAQSLVLEGGHHWTDGVAEGLGRLLGDVSRGNT